MALVRAVKKNDLFTLSHESTKDVLEVSVKRKCGVTYIYFHGKEFKVDVSKKEENLQ